MTAGEAAGGQAAALGKRRRSADTEVAASAEGQAVNEGRPVKASRVDRDGHRPVWEARVAGGPVTAVPIGSTGALDADAMAMASSSCGDGGAPGDVSGGDVDSRRIAAMEIMQPRGSHEAATSFGDSAMDQMMSAADREL